MRSMFAALLAPLVLATAIAAQGDFSSTDIGPGCGPNLAASFAPLGGGNAKMTLTISNAWAKEHTLTFWGVDTLGVTFPGTMCTFYFNAIFVHPGLTTLEGVDVYSRSWPEYAVGFFKLQALVYRTNASGVFEWQLTNGIRVDNQ